MGRGAVALPSEEAEAAEDTVAVGMEDAVEVPAPALELEDAVGSRDSEGAREDSAEPVLSGDTVGALVPVGRAGEAEALGEGDAEPPPPGLRVARVEAVGVEEGVRAAGVRVASAGVGVEARATGGDGLLLLDTAAPVRDTVGVTSRDAVGRVLAVEVRVD